MILWRSENVNVSCFWTSLLQLLNNLEDFLNVTSNKKRAHRYTVLLISMQVLLQVLLAHRQCSGIRNHLASVQLSIQLFLKYVQLRVLTYRFITTYSKIITASCWNSWVRYHAAPESELIITNASDSELFTAALDSKLNHCCSWLWAIRCYFWVWALHCRYKLWAHYCIEAHHFFFLLWALHYCSWP